MVSSLSSRKGHVSFEDLCSGWSSTGLYTTLGSINQYDLVALNQYMLPAWSITGTALIDTSKFLNEFKAKEFGVLSGAGYSYVMAVSNNSVRVTSLVSGLGIAMYGIRINYV